MGVYLKGLSMPKNCGLWVVIHPDGTVEYKTDGEGWKTMKECAVPVSPHGRLIDADALEDIVIKQKYACAGASAHGSISELHKSWGLHDAELMIEAAPTIITAEEGE